MGGRVGVEGGGAGGGRSSFYLLLVEMIGFAFGFGRGNIELIAQQNEAFLLLFCLLGFVLTLRGSFLDLVGGDFVFD